jgi:hypothetical protein
MPEDVFLTSGCKVLLAQSNDVEALYRKMSKDSWSAPHALH